MVHHGNQYPSPPSIHVLSKLMKEKQDATCEKRPKIGTPENRENGIQHGMRIRKECVSTQRLLTHGLQKATHALIWHKKKRTETGQQKTPNMTISFIQFNAQFLVMLTDHAHWEHVTAPLFSEISHQRLTHMVRNLITERSNEIMDGKTLAKGSSQAMEGSIRKKGAREEYTLDSTW